jgi:hypothetical protein
MPSWRLVTAVLVTMLAVPLLATMPSALAKPPPEAVAPPVPDGAGTLTAVAEPTGNGAEVPGLIAIGAQPPELPERGLPVTGTRLVLLGLISLGLGVAGLIAGRDRTGRRAARDARDQRGERVG